MKNKADIILHPKRMKIIQTLGGGKKLSIQEIGSILSDIPQATLYRHINTLIEHKIIQIVQENQVRGAVEKILAINEAELRNNENLSSEDHIELFTTFMTNLLGEFTQYATGPEFEPLRDGATYRQAMIHLNDEEWKAFIAEYSKLLQSALGKEPREDRKTRTLSTIIIPQKNTRKK
ncbi:helix-turn-helix domain-containing protein [Ammoniphilus sp. CFH 90114]|uniref:helix-turn-helix domain-containing protein n=1 Tax=Ammoniphilus sp. CFH 90114 TaxID=2493665 RepID=UPI00100E7851|nr:helix-turn-helix domain-containing protein [Ammoniphilus sp. CFH 90114]RXT06485.1 transcriptional regulator [Ammoniphilus sp. CFH 90114]